MERIGRQRTDIVSGLRDGIPIALGYFAVAFSLGIIAKKGWHYGCLGLREQFLHPCLGW